MKEIKSYQLLERETQIIRLSPMSNLLINVCRRIHILLFKNKPKSTAGPKNKNKKIN